jgi:hypothetical protein
MKLFSLLVKFLVGFTLVVMVLSGMLLKAAWAAGKSR